MNRLALAAVLAMLAAGCVSRADVDQISSEQFQLRGMVANDQQRVAAMDVSIRRLQDQIDQLKHGGAEAAPANADKLAALQDKLDRLDASVSALQAANAAAPTPAAAPAVTGPTGAAPAPGAAPAASLWQDALNSELASNPAGAGSKFYTEGLELMRDAKYAPAVGKFAMLQKKYPKSPLTEPAEYFSANALFENGKYDQSILQFNDLVLRFPKGRFACAALMREAEAFLKINDKIDARLTLQKLITDHSDCPEAAPAKDLLKQLES